MNALTCGVLVVGAGPAGIAAACCAAEAGRQVTVLDDNPSAGGQIWRGQHVEPNSSESADWLNRIRSSGIVSVMTGARVVSGNARDHCVMVELSSGACRIHFQKLILATGARERFLPFPGWTLPNVTGAGGLQALVQGGLPIRGKRVVIAGSGPLLLAVASHLQEKGAEVALIAEQSSWKNLLRFGFGLLRFPGKAFQALDFQGLVRRVPFKAGCWIEEAIGDGKLQGVRIRQGKRVWEEPCDYLACGFGLCPNVELAALLGCEIEDGAVRVDEGQRSSVADVYCAGEVTGIGGVDVSLIEGQIAGYVVTDRIDKARPRIKKRRQLLRFARSLQESFSLREELKSLPTSETVVCRCEDVTLGRLQDKRSWREAKLQTRCGMGPCQGRICGPVTEFLLNWKMESIRPPIFPVRLGALCDLTPNESQALARSAVHALDDV